MKQIRIFCLTLTIILILPVLLPCFVQAETVNTSLYYVALGDSIATGYALPDYKEEIPGSGTTSYYAYTCENLEQIYKKEIKKANVAVNGQTSSELLDYLQKDSSVLSGASVVTISIGSNDLLVPFVQLAADYFEIDLEEFSNGTIDLNLDTTNSLELFQSLKEFQELLTDNEQLIQKTKTLPDNLKQIISIVKQKAPEADIYVNNIYNPFRGISVKNPLTDRVIFDFAELTEHYISLLNEAFDENSPDYTLIDVRTAFENSEPTSLVNVSLTGANLDPHPNAEGHRRIAALIYNQLYIQYAKQNNLTDSLLTSVKPKKKILYLNKTAKAALTIQLPNYLEQAKKEDRSDITILYSSNKKQIASVSKKGKITAKKKGTATITTTILVDGIPTTYKTKLTIKK